jgi:hypothetical protein
VRRCRQKQVIKLLTHQYLHENLFHGVEEVKIVDCNSLERLVDLVGIEPTTSSMPWKRAPNCATGPQVIQSILADPAKIVKRKDF